MSKHACFSFSPSLVRLIFEGFGQFSDSQAERPVYSSQDQQIISRLVQVIFFSMDLLVVGNLPF